MDFLQFELAWQRSRHHVLGRAHMLLRMASASADLMCFNFSLHQQLAFLLEYEMFGKAMVPAGALLEMSSAVAAATIGDIDYHPQPILLSLSTMPALVELFCDDSPTLVVCTLSHRTGQMCAAATIHNTAQLRNCFVTTILKTKVGAGNAANAFEQHQMKPGLVSAASCCCS